MSDLIPLLNVGVCLDNCKIIRRMRRENFKRDRIDPMRDSITDVIDTKCTMKPGNGHYSMLPTSYHDVLLNDYYRFMHYIINDIDHPNRYMPNVDVIRDFICRKKANIHEYAMGAIIPVDYHIGAL